MNAKYFDGTSSFPRKVSIHFNENGFKVYDSNLLEYIAAYSYNDLKRSQNVRRGLYTYYLGENNPCPTIQTEETDINQMLRKYYPDSPLLKEIGSRAVGINSKIIAWLCLGFIGLLMFSYLVIYPFLINIGVDAMPKSVEKTMGENTYKSFLLDFEKDSITTVLLNDFYQQLNSDTIYPIKITAVKSDVKNAFALPGGNLVFFDRIISDMSSKEELIALIGHEVGHVNLRHSSKTLVRLLANYAFFSLIIGDYGGMLAGLGSIVPDLDRLKYSRKLETEADEHGYAFMKKNGADPIGMINLFEQLQNESIEIKDIESKIPNFLLTHPALSERIKKIRQKMDDEKWTNIQNTKLDTLFEKIKESAKTNNLPEGVKIYDKIE